MGVDPSPNRRWRWLLWLVPLLSVGDVLWAVGSQAGLGLTFGLGLYKWGMVHIIIQVSLIVALSLLFVVLSPSGEDVLVVEGADVGEEEGARQG
jgi:hypothetical protein